MRGKIIKDSDNWYHIEYLTEGAELDSVEKRQVRLTLIHQHRVMEGNEVDFEIREDGIATLINT